MKLVEVDAFKLNVRTGDVIARDGKIYIPVGVVNKALEETKTVDLVQCKECTFWKKAKVNSKGFLICPASGMEIMATDFCSYGERGHDK